MSLAEKLAKAIETAEEDHNYWMDIAVTDFTRDLHERMRQLNISQGELARRMGTSRPYITKLLSGGNFTLQTMVKLAMAIDAVVRVRLEGNEVRAAQRQTAAAGEASGRIIVAQIPYELEIRVAGDAEQPVPQTSASAQVKTRRTRRK